MTGLHYGSEWGRASMKMELQVTSSVRRSMSVAWLPFELLGRKPCPCDVRTWNRTSSGFFASTPAGQEYFKQSDTRLHFIAEKAARSWQQRFVELETISLCRFSHSPSRFMEILGRHRKGSPIVCPILYTPYILPIYPLKSPV